MNLYGMLSDKKALAGMLFGMNPKSIITYPASTTVAFGKGVFLNNGAVSNTKGASGVFVGVAVFHQCDGGEYVAKDSVGTMNDGNIWVVLDSEVTPTDGAPAYVKADGTFTTVSSDATLAGKFKSGAEDGLALVDLSK